jgi:hypothetical protein
VPAPGIQRVVDDEAAPQHFVVVREVVGQAERDCVKACGLGSQVQSRSIGTARNRGENLRRRIANRVLRQTTDRRIETKSMQVCAGDLRKLFSLLAGK